MAEAYWGYIPLYLVGKGKYRDERRGIFQPRSRVHQVQRWYSVLANRRLARYWGFLIVSVFIIGSMRIYSSLLIPEPPKPRKGEFDDCPSLLGPPSRFSGEHIPLEEEGPDWSQVMMPNELMDMLDKGEPLPKRIIHQSWKDWDSIPEHFQKWSQEWRKVHGRYWTYVLWTNEDNERLARDYFSEYYYAYNNLPREIYRVDMVRNMYMHLFGGIYADMDLVPRSPVYSHLPLLLAPDADESHAYIGQMGYDQEFEHALPNAFMASTLPGHPFWLRPLEYIKTYWNETEYNSTPEQLTGPVALRNCTAQWFMEENGTRAQEGRGKLQVIDDGKIYPLSWAGAPTTNWCLCREHSPWFDETKCNALYPEAWTVTYWTHSW